jgi:hypothetical protein
MIDLHEYVCLDFIEPERVHITCRYCHKHITEERYPINILHEMLEFIEKHIIVHLMQCRPFYEVKKSEIEECGL